MTPVHCLEDVSRRCSCAVFLRMRSVCDAPSQAFLDFSFLRMKSLHASCEDGILRQQSKDIAATREGQLPGSARTRARGELSGAFARRAPGGAVAAAPAGGTGPFRGRRGGVGRVSDAEERYGERLDVEDLGEPKAFRLRNRHRLLRFRHISSDAGAVKDVDTGASKPITADLNSEPSRSVVEACVKL